MPPSRPLDGRRRPSIRNPGGSVYARRDTPSWPAFLAALVPFNQSWAHAASALIIVLSKAKYTPLGQSEPVVSATASFDTGAAWASLAFQAHKFGWATHGMAGINAEAARRLVNAPVDAKIEAIVAIGRPGDPNSPPERLRAAAKLAPPARRVGVRRQASLNASAAPSR